MKAERFRALLKKLLILTNFWPAALVVFAVCLTLPQTVPVLKKLPERLAMTEVNAAEEKPALPDPEEEETIEDSGNIYKDGVYTGSSRGYGGEVTVQVTVKGRKITGVSIVSAPGETAEFLAKAKGVIDRVLQAQTWEVDAVSGATYSSRGILGAIQNALTGKTVENEAPPEKEGPVAPVKKVPFDDSVTWKDGVYTGSAKGYGGTIKVEVTIKKARIAAIRVLEHGGESDSYYNKAKRVISRIIKAGTPNVDTISGATYTSNGIINAVKNALKKAAGDSSPDTAAPTRNPVRKPSQGNTKEEEAPNIENGLKDGTYTADAVCTDGNIFEYTVRTTTVIEGGKIVSVDVERINDNSEDPDNNTLYLNYAVNGRTRKGIEYRSIVSQILDKQGTGNIDVVSGATYSSNAIMESVKKALTEAAAAYAAPGEGNGEDSGSGSTEAGQPGEGSSAGNTGSEESGEGSSAGNTGSEESGEGSSTGNTGTKGSGEGSSTGNTGTEESGEGSSTGNTGSEGSGEGSSTGNTGSEGSGEGSSTGNTGSEGSSTGDTGEEEPEEEKNTNKYLDGTYSATASCIDGDDYPLFDYKIKVTIVIKDGEITDVSARITDDDSEDPESNELYFGYAANGRSTSGKRYTGIPDQIIEKQSASGLDAVSRATYSSKAMISAAKKALSQAENPDAK